MSQRDLFGGQVSSYVLPPAVGAAGQALTTPSDVSAQHPQLTWSTPSGGGGQTFRGTGSMVIQPPVAGGLGSWVFNYAIYTSGKVVTVVGQGSSSACTFATTGGYASTVGQPFIGFAPQNTSIGVLTCGATAPEGSTVLPQISATWVVFTDGSMRIIPTYDDLAIPVTATLPPTTFVWNMP